MRNKLSTWILWGLVIILLAILPRLVNFYYLNLFLAFAIYSFYAVTLNLLLGYMGVLSFGHAMFFGTGAYAVALVLRHIEGFPFLPTILIGGLSAGLLAAILSPMLVRVGGTAFAMLTMAFSQLIYVGALKWRDVTGGDDGIGITSVPPLNIPGLASIDMADKINFYYFAIIFVALCLFLLWYYTKTPFGSLIVGVRDNALRMDYLGFNLQQTRAINLLVSGTFAGLAGAVHGLHMKLVTTVGVLDIGTCFKPLMMAYIGGVGSFFGPILGSGILHILEDVVIRFTDRIGLVNGAIFVLVVLFAPQGLIGLFRTLKAKWFQKETA
ncbi:MAG: branched-chain amino acid ABC transporter permease [Deltaproteobacteria bacterium]|nr:branched-chain amino acid ABC transporter permease [Deltaproteobacteria bacterium]